MGQQGRGTMDDGRWLAALIEQQPKGHTLLQPFYTDPRMLDWDVEVVFSRNWLLAGHTSRIPEPGDYFIYELAGEELIVVRGDAGEVHALVNVCRHRGSRVCLSAEGNAATFVCPYHAWTYGREGALRSARNMPGDFERATHGLHTAQVREIEGLIFLYLGDDAPPDLDPAARAIGDFLGPHGIPNARIAEREVGVVNANWKLVIENFLECYHCAPAHPEYTKRNPVTAWHFAQDKRGERANQLVVEWSQRTAKMGHVVGAITEFDDDAQAGVQEFGCGRVPLDPEFVSQTRDGRAVAPLMGSLSDFDGGETGVQVGHTSFALAYNDYAILIGFTPKSALETVYEFTWLVGGSAEPGRDYDPDEVTWLWRTTNNQDTTIVNANQRGVSSRWYRPGPYSEGEPYTRSFVEGYLESLREGVEGRGRARSS